MTCDKMIVKNKFKGVVMNNSKKQQKYIYTVLWLPILLVGLLFLSGEIVAYLFRSLSTTNTTYIQFDDNIIRILFLFLIILDFVILGFYFIKMLGKDIEFNSRYIGSVIDAKRTAINCLGVCSFIFVLAILCLLLSVNSRTQADNEGFKKYNLIEQDSIIFEYEDAESVNVHLEWVYRGKHNNGYATVINVETESNVYTFDSTGFSDDYYYIEKFLSNFNDEIITIDKTFSTETDDIIGYYEQNEAFKNIYN